MRATAFSDLRLFPERLPLQRELQGLLDNVTSMPRRLAICGPYGSGRTAIAKALAGERDGITLDRTTGLFDESDLNGARGTLFTDGGLVDGSLDLLDHVYSSAGGYPKHTIEQMPDHLSVGQIRERLPEQLRASGVRIIIIDDFAETLIGRDAVPLLARGVEQALRFLASISGISLVLFGSPNLQEFIVRRRTLAALFDIRTLSGIADGHELRKWIGQLEEDELPGCPLQLSANDMITELLTRSDGMPGRIEVLVGRICFDYKIKHDLFPTIRRSKKRSADDEQQDRSGGKQ
jgi:hypothetical protein